jgi:alkylhydroperoxidase/carboxymuconolactone decarboxylase family protein YurZ
MAEKWQLSDRGKRAAKERYGDDGDRSVAEGYDRMAGRIDEDWSYLYHEFVPNGIYARSVMTTGMRELIAVAVLTAIHSRSQLRTHIQIALRSNPAVQVREAILQSVPYLGFPRVYDALEIFEQVITEPEFSDLNDIERRP